MLSTFKTAPMPRVILGIALAAVVGGCQPSAGASPTTPATPSPSPSLATVDGGTITLTDDDCTWEGNPGSVSGSRVTVEVRNETDDDGLFIVHRLKPEFTWQDGIDAIAAIAAAIEAGEDWPNWAMNVSKPEGEGEAAAGGAGTATIGPLPGTIGVVCSANSPTEDVLSIFLAGPLEVGG